MLKEETASVDHIKEELKAIVASRIAKYAVPDHILVSGRLRLVPAAGNAHIKQASLSCLQCCCSGRRKRQENRTGRRDPGRGRASAVVCLHVREALRGSGTAQLACSDDLHPHQTSKH